MSFIWIGTWNNLFPPWLCFCVCKTLPFFMGLIFVTQFIVTWQYNELIEIQSWHINKLVHTDNYYYYSCSIRLWHEVKALSFSLAFLRKIILKLPTVKHKQSTSDLYIVYGYAKNLWLQLQANIYLMFATEERTPRKIFVITRTVEHAPA